MKKIASWIGSAVSIAVGVGILMVLTIMFAVHSGMLWILSGGRSQPKNDWVHPL